MARLPLDIRVLGPPSVTDAAGREIPIPHGKPLALVVHLACHPEGVPRDHAAALLWPEVSPNRQRASLRQALWLVRRAAGETLLDEGDPLRLRPGAVRLDLELLKEALEADDLDRALALWRGRPFELFPLPGLTEWEEWTEQVRVRLEHLFGGALQAEAERLRREGDSAGAFERLERAASVQPYRAEIHLEAVRCLIELRRLEEARGRIAQHRLAFADDERVMRELDALEAEAERPRRDRRRAAHDPFDPPLEFVGRSREYTTLLALWREVPRRGAAVGVVVGEPGIGTTRLIDEVALAATDAGGRLVRVVSERAERRLEWGGLRELVKRLMGLSGAAGVAPASDEILRGLVPSLGSSPSAGGNGEVRVSSAQLLDALADLVGAVSEDAHLILLLDDLHFMDVESRTVLVSLVRRLDREPVFVLVTSRSGGGDSDLQSALALLRRHPRGRALRLGPWTPGEVLELLESVARPSDPARMEEVAGRIHRVTGGVPLFVVEVLKELRDRGVLQETDDPARPGGPILHVERVPSDLRLPPAARAVLDERLGELSAEAALLAAHMARAPRPERPSRLARRAGMRETAVNRGAAELLDRDLVRWHEGHTLAFTQEAIRAAVAERFGGLADPGEDARRAARVRAWVTAAAAAAVLVAFGLVWRALAPPVPDPPYGGGAVVLVWADTVLAVTPGQGPPHAWAVGPVDGGQPPGRADVRGVGRAADGRVLWFAQRITAEDPPWLVELLPDGRERELVREEGDVTFWHLARDGRTVLFTAENVGASTYRKDLYLLDLEEPEPRRIARGEDFIRGARMSPDNRRIVYRAAGPEDTLVVLTPDGGRLAAVPSGSLAFPVWCGGGHRLFALLENGGLHRLHEVLWEREEIRPVVGSGGEPPPPAPRPLVACSPDGSAVLYTGAVEGEDVLVLHDLRAGTTALLPVPRDLPVLRLGWLPPEPRPGPRRLRAEAATLRMAWGEAREVGAELVLSDGAREPAGEVRWSAETPRIASVTPAGRVHANAPGTARLFAAWDGWLADTVTVEVEGEAPEGPLFQDDFAAIPTHVWLPLGHPVPHPGLRDGEPVLVVPGDGRHWDGIVSAEAFELPLGATLEAEFRLPLTLPAHQRARLCLLDGELPEHAAEGFHVGEIVHRQQLCFVYPAEELARRDDAQVLLAAWNRYALRFDASPHLPSGDWVHVALQLRADGHGSLFVNGELVGEGPLRLRNAGVRWHVAVAGASVDTELLFRRLRLHAGQRFGG